jgi:hypothetical protein
MAMLVVAVNISMATRIEQMITKPTHPQPSHANTKSSNDNKAPDYQFHWTNCETNNSNLHHRPAVQQHHKKTRTKIPVPVVRWGAFSSIWHSTVVSLESDSVFFLEMGNDLYWRDKRRVDSHTLKRESPLRGTLGTLTQFALVIGFLAADLLAFPFATEHGWRFLFSITALTAFSQSLFLESPRWLLNRDPKSLRARYIIKRLRGLRYDEEVEAEVGNFVIGEAAQHQEDAD